jgi:hypothetical protein
LKTQKQENRYKQGAERGAEGLSGAQFFTIFK